MKLKIALLLTLALTCLFLFSCDNQNNDIVQNGIVIEDSVPQSSFSEETCKHARDVISSLLKEYYEKSTGASLPPATLEKIQLESKKIAEATMKGPIKEEGYLSILSYLEKNKSTIVDSVISESKSILTIKSLYRELSSLVDSNYLGYTAYSLMLYYYDYQYNECMQRYEKYGYSFLLEDASKAQQSKSIFENDVGAKGFCEASKAFFFASELFYSEIYNDTTLASFTNEEILILIQGASFALHDITPRGYELLLSYIPTSSEVDYFSRLFDKAKENGDLSILANKINDVTGFISYLQKSLTSDQCEYIRKKDTEGLILSLMRNLDKEGWELFESATNITLSNEDYNQIATDEFKEAYGNFLSSKVYTLEELKGEIKGNNASNALKGYIAGIMPAFAYLINYDKN